MTEVAHSQESKARAVARIYAMRGDLSYTVHKKAKVWLLKVRTRDGTLFSRHDSDLVEVVDLVHAYWAPYHAKQREELVARAAKFNVADVAEQEADFTGIHKAPENRIRLYAHFYDTLIELQENRPTLMYNSISPAGWVLKPTGSAGNDVIVAPTFRKLCNRLDAWMHNHFLKQREEIRAAAKESTLVEDNDDETDSEEEPTPIVVIPPPRSEAVNELRMPARLVLVATAAFFLVLGMLLGAIIAVNLM